MQDSERSSILKFSPGSGTLVRVAVAAITSPVFGSNCDSSHFSVMYNSLVSSESCDASERLSPEFGVGYVAAMLLLQFHIRYIYI